MDNAKDLIALAELSTIINRLRDLAESARSNVGKSRPVVSPTEIELIKDHLDLVIKYTKL
uniref:Uncharacterized protein n=1 Tax=viral metagenome TaxID=1070528 RepID=A0A6M3LFZ4_9ZZZZ